VNNIDWENAVEAFEERAAIIEYEGNFTKARAEYEAFCDTIQLFGGSRYEGGAYGLQYRPDLGHPQHPILRVTPFSMEPLQYIVAAGNSITITDNITWSKVE